VAHVGHRVRAALAGLHDVFLFLVVLREMVRDHRLCFVVSCLSPFNDCNCPAGNSFFST
jgi:hypothetical protein